MNKIQNDRLQFSMRIRTHEGETTLFIPRLIESITTLLKKGMVGLRKNLYRPGFDVYISDMDRYENGDVGTIIKGYSLDRFTDIETDNYHKFKYINLFKTLSKEFNKDIEVYFYDPYTNMEKHLKVNKIEHNKYREYVETNVPVKILLVDCNKFKTFQECQKHCQELFSNLLKENKEEDIYIKGDFIIIKGNQNIVRDNFEALNLKEIKSTFDCNLKDIFITEGEIILGGMGYYKNKYQFTI